MARAVKGKNTGPSLDLMRSSYRNAREVGDKEEEARWANQIGHAYKDRGEYVTALKWFRKDYEISLAGKTATDHIKLMPTCQSLGEVYLRLHNYDDALTYQGKHFHLAEEAGDLVEQQRASTQLARTYLELYETKDRVSALQDAKFFSQKSLDLACLLRANPPKGEISPSAFVVEVVDAYNNLGLASALAEDFKQASGFYLRGLRLCNQEEVDENDAARSRIHHNLGRLYSELREWDKAKEHTEMDIEICQRIPHAQGEAKGLMNLADLCFKLGDYDQATRCFKRALLIAQTLEDEDQLCSQIKSNMEVVGQAKAKSKTFELDMKKLSKLRRDVEASKGTTSERSHIRQECKLLRQVTCQAEELQAWDVHLGLAKRFKRLSKELGDNEMLGDALETLASSYYNLRKFEDAIKWHLRSFEQCKRIGHLEGQIVAKINCGNALDATGRFEDALQAYQEALEAAKTDDSPKMIEQQISALDNIHYCYFVRLGRLDDARDIQLQLTQLKHTRGKSKTVDDEDERCSETGSEGNSEGASGESSHCNSDEIPFKTKATNERFTSAESKKMEIIASDSDQEYDDNLLLASLHPKISTRRPLRKIGRNTSLPLNRRLRKQKGSTNCSRQLKGRRKVVVSDEEMSDASLEREGIRGRFSEPAREQSGISEESDRHAQLAGDVVIGIKPRILSSAGHDATTLEDFFEEDFQTLSAKRARTSDTTSKTQFLPSPLYKLDDLPASCDNDFLGASDIRFPIQTPNERSLCASRMKVPPPCSETSCELGPRSTIPVTSWVEPLEPASAEVPLIAVEERAGPPSTPGSSHMDVQIGTVAHSTPVQVLKDMVGVRVGLGKNPLLERYLAHCTGATVGPNSLLVEKLLSQKVSEEVVVTCCDIDDKGAQPLLAALGESDAFSLLDMSHNLLGNATVHAIQDLIKSTNQTDLGLTLDLHCNKLGAGALLQICRCPISLSRLEVLDLSGNRLTDAAARHLSRILKESQALATLNLESCALTTRSIKQLTCALDRESSLIKLCIGKNHPIAGVAIQELLHKLSSLTSFSELDMKGVELDDAAVAGVTSLLKESKSISTLILEGTDLRNEGALAISSALNNTTSRLAKLDVSLCGFNLDPAVELCSRLISIQSLSNLNLSGNHLEQKAAEAIGRGLTQTGCRLKVLDLSRCHLSQSDVLLIIRSVRDQMTLLDLNLAGNLTDLRAQLPQSGESAILDCRSVDLSEGQAESTSATVDHYIQRNCENIRLQDGSTYFLREVVGPGGSHNEQQNDAALDANKRVVRPQDRDGNQAQTCVDHTANPERLDIDKRQGPPKDMDGIRAKCSMDQTHRDCGVETTLRSESNEMECVPDSPDSQVNGIQLTQTDPRAVDRETNLRSDPQTKSQAVNLERCSSATSAHEFCEQLASSIRMARGLRLLDLSDNQLGPNDIELLYLAWTACPRGGSSLHQQHVDAGIVHFFVQERPCVCTTAACCRGSGCVVVA